MKNYRLLACFAGIGLLAAAFSFSKKTHSNRLASPLEAKSGFIRTDGGYSYRDLNKNGKLDT
jgi:hypothetical protein